MRTELAVYSRLITSRNGRDLIKAVFMPALAVHNKGIAKDPNVTSGAVGRIGAGDLRIHRILLARVAQLDAGGHVGALGSNVELGKAEIVPGMATANPYIAVQSAVTLAAKCRRIASRRRGVVGLDLGLCAPLALLLERRRRRLAPLASRRSEHLDRVVLEAFDHGDRARKQLALGQAVA